MSDSNNLSLSEDARRSLVEHYSNINLDNLMLKKIVENQKPCPLEVKKPEESSLAKAIKAARGGDMPIQFKGYA